MSISEDSSKNFSFFKKFENFPLLSLALIYGCTLLIAAIFTPYFFNIVVYWSNHSSNDLAQYLLRKGFPTFFGRIQLVALFLFFPILLRLYRRKTAGSTFNHFHPLSFLSFFGLGMLLISTVFGIKMLFLDFKMHLPPSLIFFLSKTLTTAFLIALFEEWLFRGFIFRSLLDITRPLMALFLSTFIFAYFHFLPAYQLPEHTEFAMISEGFRCFYETLFHTFSNISWFKFTIIAALGGLLATVSFYTKNLFSSVGLHTGIVFSLMVFKNYFSFYQENKFFGSNHLFDSPFALILIAITIFYVVQNYCKKNIENKS
jgi:membrane protease YdiL (CAAX protease family)